MSYLSVRIFKMYDNRVLVIVYDNIAVRFYYIGIDIIVISLVYCIVYYSVIKYYRFQYNFILYSHLKVHYL